MAHGTPDYGVTSGRVSVYQVKDLGELAARLGSPVTFDRRGDVAWWDDFECGFAKWVGDNSGTGASVALSTVRARNGRMSSLLTGGSDADRRARIGTNQPVRVVSPSGLECSFHWPANLDAAGVRLGILTGTTHYRGAVRWSNTSKEIQYLDNTNNYVAAATGVDLAGFVGLFHTLKVVIDPTVGRYVRLIVDDREIDLDGVALFSQAALFTAVAVCEAELISRAGANDIAYVDDVILTQNEPANP